MGVDMTHLGCTL